MMKIKLHYLLMAIFGLALFACETNEPEIVKPGPSGLDGISSSASALAQEAETCGESKTVPINSLDFSVPVVVGEATYSNDDTYLYVHISIPGPHTINEAQNPNIFLWIGNDILDYIIPPDYPGLFAANFPHTSYMTGTEHTVMIPLNEIEAYNQECGVQELTILLGARVLIDGSFPFDSFAGNTGVDGSAPWWYDTYTPQCCEDGEESCETAYVKFSQDLGYVFASSDKANPEGYNSLGLSNNQWGWAGLFSGDGEYGFDIYAAAGLNDITKGTLVGTATVEIDGNDVTVCYDMLPGYELDEVHIYVSNDPPTTTAPGQYGWTVEFDEGENEYCNTFEVDGSQDIWVIGHAVVCGEFPTEDDD